MSVDLGRGLIMQNQVGLASGCAGYGFELEQLIDINSIGALFTKGTTRQPRSGNPPPRVAETPGGMLNSIGLQNPGVEWVREQYAAQFTRWRCPVVVNVCWHEGQMCSPGTTRLRASSSSFFSVVVNRPMVLR